MSETLEDIDELLIRILDDSADRADLLVFAEWIRHEGNMVYFEEFKKIWHLSHGIQCDDTAVEEGWKHYKQFIVSSRKVKILSLSPRIWSYAAAVVILVLPAYWLLKPDRAGIEEKMMVTEYVDIPMENVKGVTLVLAGGKTVKVSGVGEQEILDKESGVRIKQEAEKGLVYEVSGEPVAEKESTNEVIVPRGERMSLTLSDGTKVWLNSESAIRNPARFGDEVRVVTVKGNAYFEVEKDAKRPFRVLTRGMIAEVLGTSFEVNTYEDHGDVSITLVEGSVQMKAGGKVAVARPDEKVSLHLASGEITTEVVEASRVVAWKEGVLIFKNEPFADVIRKLERWFDIKIEDRSTGEKHLLFNGVFERENVAIVLETVCANLNINYTISGREVIFEN